MLIAIEYKNGRIKEFDPGAFTEKESLALGDRMAKNVVTEFDLRLDRIVEDGLRLNIYWHDSAKPRDEIVLDGVTDEKGYEVMMPVADRRVGISVVIANKTVLEEISRIQVHYVGGTTQVAWRQGDGNWLILGSQFDAQRLLTYTDANTTSINSQAVRVFDYLRKTYSTLTDEEVSQMMGYPYDAFLQIRRDEAAQLNSSDSIDHMMGRTAEALGVTPTVPETVVSEADVAEDAGDVFDGAGLGYADVIRGFDDDDYDEEE